jgi:cell division protein FtsB
MRWTAPGRVLIVVLVTVAALFLFVFPTKAYLAQRRDISDARARVQIIEQQNERLEKAAARLRDPDEIEAIAREKYHLVSPGERGFAVIGAPSAPTSVPTTAPRTSDAPDRITD